MIVGTAGHSDHGKTALVKALTGVDADRLKVYRCIEALIGLDGMGTHPTALVALYGEDTLALAERLLDGEERFFGLNTLGANFEGSRMHTKLLAAYAKAQAGVI